MSAVCVRLMALRHTDTTKRVQQTAAGVIACSAVRPAVADDEGDGGRKI